MRRSRRLLSMRRRRSGSVVRRSDRFSFPNIEDRRVQPSAYGESSARGTKQIDKKMEALKKYDTQLPDGISLSMENIGARHLTFKEWEVYDHPNTLRDLSKVTKTWERHAGVLATVVDGKMGTFDASDSQSLDEVYNLYKLFRNSKTPIMGMLDNVTTQGGLALLGKRSTATIDAVLTPILNPNTLEDLPRFIDGGVGFLLSRTGKYGRCAALSGSPVRGYALKLSGLVKTVLTEKSFGYLYDEIFHLAKMGDGELITEHLDSVLEMMALPAEMYVQDDEHDFKELAELCFEPQQLDKIYESLQAALPHNPLAETALHTLNQLPNHAKLVSALLQKCAKLSYRECLDLELVVNKNLLKKPIPPSSENFTSTDIDAYFEPPQASAEQQKLGF